MVIIHIAKLQNRIYSGVDQVVPMQVITQQDLADVCLYNLCDIDINGVHNLFKYSQISIRELPNPFDRPDLVIIHEDYNIENLGIYRYLKRMIIPYIIVPHCELTQEAQHKKWLKKKIANALLFNRFINNALAIQCLSQHEMDTTKFEQKKFIGTNGVVLPNMKKSSFNKERIIFTYIGRLDIYHKGLDLLIKAASKIRPVLMNNNVQINIYGPDFDGQNENLKKMVNKAKLDKVITLHDAVNGKIKESILLDTDIFIQTSRFEGMPMGILEALSYGIPCLVTEGTTLANIIDIFNAGWTTQTDIDSIALSIKRAIESKACFYDKSINAVRLIDNTFKWEQVTTNNLIKYEELIKQFKDKK